MVELILTVRPFPPPPPYSTPFFFTKSNRDEPEADTKLKNRQRSFKVSNFLFPSHHFPLPLFPFTFFKKKLFSLSLLFSFIHPSLPPNLPFTSVYSARDTTGNNYNCHNYGYDTSCDLTNGLESFYVTACCTRN